MKPVHVCVPVLKRYDLLRLLLASLGKSSVRPTCAHIINNGRDGERLVFALRQAAPNFALDIYTPDENLGVAASWNWFIKNVPEERVICNDDIIFAPWSLERLLASDAALIWSAGHGFSCYVLRDEAVQKIGLFDETISPGYGYYEDDDYLQRLDGRGTRPQIVKAENVDCGIRHEHSATLKAASHAEVLEHHRKFKIAQANYKAKWPECGL